MSGRTSTTGLTGTLAIPSHREVILCMGPGGVGKTTVAASLGLAAASAGRKVVVVTIDPSWRLAQALGIADDRTQVAGTVTPVPGTAEAGVSLSCLLLDTSRVFDAIVRQHAPTPEASDRMLADPIYRATVRYLGGALEYAAIAQVHMLHDDGNHDLIVLDTPPIANALAFVDAPQRLAEILNNPAAKLLAGSGSLGSKIFGLAGNVLVRAFEAVGGGQFVGQLGAFLRDFGAIVGEFHRRAGDVAKLLVSKRTGVVVATSATEFNVREAKSALRTLSERGLAIDGVVLNRVDPILPDFGQQAGLRAALEQVLEPGRAGPVSAGLFDVYTRLQQQSRRERVCEQDLKLAYPQIPLVALERVDPPPTSLEALRSLGEQLWG